MRSYYPPASVFRPECSINVGIRTHPEMANGTTLGDVRWLRGTAAALPRAGFGVA